MSIIDGTVDGLIALVGVLPSDPYLTSGLAAVTAGAVICVGWQKTNPYRMLRAEMPVLTGGTPAAAPPPRPTVERASVAPLEIGLDEIPRDDHGLTPYDLIGPHTIRIVVDQFYSKMCADPDLAEFFEHVDMASLKRHQAQFIGQLWGGPVRFPLERLADAHQHLHISPERYWRVAGYLMVTLTHLDVPDWICVFTMTRLYQAMKLIVGQDLAGAEPREESTAVQPQDSAAAEPGE
jgi:hemoglobin